MKYFERDHSNQLSYTFHLLKVSCSDLFSVLLKHSLVEYTEYRSQLWSLCHSRLQKFNFFSKAAYQVRDMHDKVLFSDLDIPVTHISYTDTDTDTDSDIPHQEATILDNINGKPRPPPLPPPKSRMGKWRVFALRAASLLILGGRGFAVPFYFVQDCSS